MSITIKEKWAVHKGIPAHKKRNHWAIKIGPEKIMFKIMINTMALSGDF